LANDFIDPKPQISNRSRRNNQIINNKMEKDKGKVEFINRKELQQMPEYSN